MTDASIWGTNFAGTSMVAYDETLVRPLFIPWAEHLVAHAGIRMGEDVLDVACGPGTVARVAAPLVGPDGSVVGCDLSEEMLMIARSKGDVGSVHVEYRQCPAEALDVDDDSCDVSLCQQGLQFFPDRVAALREMRRVLKPRGRVAVSVWCEIEACEPFAALEEAIGVALGRGDAAGYRNGPWALCDAQVLLDELSDAGFDDVQISRDEISVEFDGGPAQLVRTLGAAPVGAKVATLDDKGRHAFHDAVETAVAPLTSDGVVRGITTCHTATGTA